MPPEKHRKQDIAEELFSSREFFRKKVEEALDWSEKGGPQEGTRSFIKAIYNEEAEGKLSAEKFSQLKARINQEKNRIKAQRKKQLSPDEEDRSQAFTKEETERMMDGARKQEWRESRRSGGVDPNET